MLIKWPQHPKSYYKFRAEIRELVILLSKTKIFTNCSTIPVTENLRSLEFICNSLGWHPETCKIRADSKCLQYRSHQSSTTCGASDDRRISLKAIDERVFTKFRNKKCRIYKFAQQKCRIYPFSRQKCRILLFYR